MENAKKVYVLSNGELVSMGDLVKVNTNDGTLIIKVNAIDETFIAGIILNGEESDTSFDAYFSDLKDVRVLK